MESRCTFCRRALLGLILVQTTLYGSSSLAWAQSLVTGGWTTIGSAGTVDTGSVAAVTYDHAAAVLNGNGPATIRYNVVNTDLLTDDINPLIAMQVLYKAPTGLAALVRSSRVVARLVEVDLASGAETTKLTFDSNNFPALNDIGEHSVCLTGPVFDFFNNAYYIEVVLSKSRFLQPLSPPALKGILLLKASGCGN